MIFCLQEYKKSVHPFIYSLCYVRYCVKDLGYRDQYDIEHPDSLETHSYMKEKSINNYYRMKIYNNDNAFKVLKW